MSTWLMQKSAPQLEDDWELIILGEVPRNLPVHNWM